MVQRITDVYQLVLGSHPSWYSQPGMPIICSLLALAAAETAAAVVAVAAFCCFWSAGSDARVHSRLHAQDAPEHSDRVGRTALSKEGAM